MSLRRVLPILMRLALAATLLAGGAQAASGGDEISDAERLELAARLTADGEYERAARALGKVDGLAARVKSLPVNVPGLEKVATALENNKASIAKHELRRFA